MGILFYKASNINQPNFVCALTQCDLLELLPAEEPVPVNVKQTEGSFDLDTDRNMGELKLE